MAAIPNLKYSALRPLLERIDLTAADIGARGGPEPDLLPIAFATNLVAFEPESAAHAALAEQPPGPWKSRTLLPVALGARAERRTLHVTTDPQSTSLLEPDPAFGVLFEKPQFFQVRETRAVDTVSLDDALAGIAAGPIGFIKLDVEGAEIEVLSGARAALRDVAAIKIEFSLYPFRRGQPLLGDLIGWLSGHGFGLFDLLDLARWRRRGYAIHPFLGKGDVPYSRGSLMHGDALFLRHVLPGGEESGNPALRLRAVVVLLAYGYFDHALMILETPAVRAQIIDETGVDPVRAVGDASRRYGRHAWRRAATAQMRLLLSQILSRFR